MEDRVLVEVLHGQYRGWVLRKPRSEAENLVMTGQARWKEETRPLARVETPETPDLSAMTKEQLVTLAEARGVDVVRLDGEDGIPLKSDYIAALGG